MGVGGESIKNSNASMKSPADLSIRFISSYVTSPYRVVFLVQYL